MAAPPSFAQFLQSKGMSPESGWGPVANNGMYEGVGLPDIIDYPEGGAIVANTALAPQGTMVYEDGSIGPMPPPPSQGTVEMLPGLFGGGGQSTFVANGATPQAPQSTGTIAAIAPPAPAPIIGARPGDVLDANDSGTIDYLMGWSPQARWP